MYPFIDREHALLELRVDELESRLAELKDEVRELRAAQAQRADDGAHIAAGSEVPFGRRSTDAALAASIDGPHGGQEGARLVAIEMLTCGYTQEQIETYLSQTFGIEHPEALIADAGPAAR